MRFLQIFHSVNKQINFFGIANAVPIDMQVGKCEVEIDDDTEMADNENNLYINQIIRIILR